MFRAVSNLAPKQCPGGSVMRKSLRSLLYGRSGIRHGGGLSLEEAIVGNGTSVSMSTEKPQVVGTTRATVRMRHRGADCLAVAMKRSNARAAKGVGHPRRTIIDQLETGGARRFGRRAAALIGWRSRVTGDCHARICEELGVKFPRLTRRRSLSVICGF